MARQRGHRATAGKRPKLPVGLSRHDMRVARPKLGKIMSLVFDAGAGCDDLPDVQRIKPRKRANEYSR
jgi:hypothetical protein